MNAKLGIAIKVAVVAMGGLLPIHSHAEYVSMSLGQSQTAMGPNGEWRQEEFPYEQNTKSTAYRFALGGKPFRFMRAEVDYTNFGNINGSFFYVSDENYNPNANDGGPHNRPCNNPCEPTRAGAWTGKASGIGISLLPEFHLTHELSVFGRFGVMRYTAETNVRTTNYGAPPGFCCGQTLPADPDYALGVFHYKKVGISKYLGGGVQYEKGNETVAIEAVYVPDLSSGVGGIQHGIRAGFVTYRRGF